MRGKLVDHIHPTLSFSKFRLIGSHERTKYERYALVVVPGSGLEVWELLQPSPSLQSALISSH